MFVALRDLRHARGRFALMLVVIVLTTFLTTFLASLTAGLARESTSAITDLPADRLAFTVTEAGAAPDFTTSAVTPRQWQGWADVPGVRRAEPLGVATTRAQTADATASVTALGVLPGSSLLPPGSDGLADGAVVLSRDAATALAVGDGDTIVLAGRSLTVAAVVTEARSFAHTPVLWTTLRDWQALGTGPSADEPTASVVALTLDGADDAGIARADRDLGTTTRSLGDARSAIGSFSAENGSLTTIQVFLVAISALVIGAFFAVWTVGRTGDVALLKALGASTTYLLRDAVGQAATVLALGTATGAGLAALGATLASGAIPVVVGVGTTVLPAVALLLTGLAGAMLAVAGIVRVDPHAALAAR